MKTHAERHQSKAARSPLSKDIHGCVRTLGILMCPSEICIDKQQREEAIEVRQAPKSVKACYPREKINVLPSEWARCSAQRSHAAAVSEVADPGWLTFNKVRLAGPCLLKLLIKSALDYFECRQLTCFWTLNSFHVFSCHYILIPLRLYYNKGFFCFERKSPWHELCPF